MVPVTCCAGEGGTGEMQASSLGRCKAGVAHLPIPFTVLRLGGQAERQGGDARTSESEPNLRRIGEAEAPAMITLELWSSVRVGYST